MAVQRSRMQSQLVQLCGRFIFNEIKNLNKPALTKEPRVPFKAKTDNTSYVSVSTCSRTVTGNWTENGMVVEIIVDRFKQRKHG